MMVNGQRVVKVGCFERQRCTLFPVKDIVIWFFRQHRMHEMLTILTSVRDICLSVGSNRWWHVQCAPRAMCAGSFGAAFVKCFRPRFILSRCIAG